MRSNININLIKNLKAVNINKFNVLTSYKDDFEINFGEDNIRVGEVAIESFMKATQALKDGGIDVLVTAPINKHNIQSETFNFPGHTDYLNQELEGESLMLMVNDNLRVGLLTDHLAVKDVSEAITPQLIKRKIETIYNSLRQDFKVIKPKIAVLGINPHTGDNGVIGDEDDMVLKPSLDKIKKEGKLVFGPYSADSFFGSDNYKQFDAIIASYHDQGLIPFKTLSFGEGVNYTAGLNKIRTSPDHGTAYEIAGKRKAEVDSFRQAIYTAVDVFKKRSDYKKMTSSPLKPQKSVVRQK